MILFGKRSRCLIFAQNEGKLDMGNMETEKMRTECLEHGICGDYLVRYDACRTPEDLYDLACTSEGLMWLTKCCSGGWGFTQKSLKDTLGDFVNGRKKAVIEGRSGSSYDSMLCVGFFDVVRVETTLCGFIGCDCDVVIVPGAVCRLYADARSTLRVLCPPGATAIIETYSDRVSVSGGGRTRILRARGN